MAYPGRPAALTGARDGAALVEAVEALRGAVWEMLLQELGSGSDAAGARRLTDASDRLAHVCAALAGAALEAIPDGQRETAAAPERSHPGPRGVPESRIVIIDERGAEEPPGEAPVAGERDTGRAPAPAEIEIRDARREQGPSAWIGSIGRQLERFERDGLPFAVVLMEIDRDRGSAPVADDDELEQVLADELREAGGGTVTRERAGRYWLLVPRADRIGAHALAARLEQAVAAAAARRGAPVPVASGTAVCPEDGRQAAALAAHADVGLYAARWEARSATAGRTAAEDRS